VGLGSLPLGSRALVLAGGPLLPRDLSRHLSRPLVHAAPTELPQRVKRIAALHALEPSSCRRPGRTCVQSCFWAARRAR
jgi:hypothetical protein